MKPDGCLFDSVWRKSCTVEKISRIEAGEMIKSHYLKKWPGVTVLVLGLKRDGELLGVIVYALPPRETSKRYCGHTWELARLWLKDAVPKNAETFFIAKSVKWIKSFNKNVDVLVSYADPSAGHSGTIYRASNWLSDGRTDQERKTARFDYADSATGKKYSRRGHVPESVSIVKIPRVSKFRFFIRLKKTRTAA